MAAYGRAVSTDVMAMNSSTGKVLLRDPQALVLLVPLAQNYGHEYFPYV